MIEERKICEDVRLGDLSKYREMIKRESKEVEMFPAKEVLNEKTERAIIYRTHSF